MDIQVFRHAQHIFFAVPVFIKNASVDTIFVLNHIIQKSSQECALNIPISPNTSFLCAFSLCYYPALALLNAHCNLQDTLQCHWEPPRTQFPE